MGIIIDILSVLVIICLIGALLFATKALKAKSDEIVKKQNIQKAGLFIGAYVILNLLRLLMENYLV